MKHVPLVVSLLATNGFKLLRQVISSINSVVIRVGGLLPDVVGDRLKYRR